MRARPFALVGLVAGLALSAHAGQEPAVDYKPFASSDGRYKVLFPGGVRSETADVKTPAGVKKITLDTVQLPGGIVFMVTYVDVADDVAQAAPGPRLDKVRDGNKGTDGKIVADKEVVVGVEKHPGRDLLIEKPATVLRGRVVIVGSRLYQVMIQGSKEFVTSKDADRFIESFEITK